MCLQQPDVTVVEMFQMFKDLFTLVLKNVTFSKVKNAYLMWLDGQNRGKIVFKCICISGNGLTNWLTADQLSSLLSIGGAIM